MAHIHIKSYLWAIFVVFECFKDKAGQSAQKAVCHLFFVEDEEQNDIDS